MCHVTSHTGADAGQREIGTTHRQIRNGRLHRAKRHLCRFTVTKQSDDLLISIISDYRQECVPFKTVITIARPPRARAHLRPRSIIFTHRAHTHTRAAPDGTNSLEQVTGEIRVHKAQHTRQTFALAGAVSSSKQAPGGRHTHYSA